MAAQHPAPGRENPPDPTIGALVHDLTEQVPALVRSEIRLAQAEVAQKGKRLGVGLGMFSASGLLAFFGLASAITTVVLLLDLALPAWAAALIVTIALFAVAAGAAVLGKSKVEQATPPIPEKAIAGTKEDLATLKEIKP
ncbi:phage holin family protein [Nocardioides marmorisolisilvae]|uniref:Phage holin family protein n=1 Tax=Nocardioides marmorisolisilvae TaxID=1542737 RepID=A0A3N0DTG4_9ACTN|nr:phage holin family protein [Nocardioides marmorisolisilvae]RNL78890.1 phage holin family protein [Nocardioides marmorisolisilvae]